MSECAHVNWIECECKCVLMCVRVCVYSGENARCEKSTYHLKCIYFLGIQSNQFAVARLLLAVGSPTDNTKKYRDNTVLDEVV